MLAEYWYVFIIAAFIVVFFGVRIGGAAAKAIYDRKSALDPLSCAELKIGQKFELDGKFDMAVKAYSQVVEKYPHSETGYLFLGYLHKKRKDFAAAAEAFGGALKVDPDSIEALCELAGCNWQAGRNDEASAIFSQVLEKDPGNADAHYALGVIHFDDDRPSAVVHLKAFKDSAEKSGSRRYGQMLKRTEELLGDTGTST